MYEVFRFYIKKCIDDIMDCIEKNGLDPLDMDETENLTHYFNAEINWQNGNLTSEEHETAIEHIQPIIKKVMATSSEGKR